jgi:WD40 repeat protein
VTHKLIDEPGFLDDFEANDWTLPRDYESKLSAKAKLHVDMLASGLRRNSRRLQSIESTSSDSFGSGYGRSGSQSSQDIDQNISEDLDSSSGPQFQDEKVFANLPKTALPHYRLQSTPIDDYYSSPTTSVATEHLDRTSKDDAESLDPKRLKVKPQESSRQLRRSSRLLRSSVPPEITTDDNSRTRRAVNSKNNSSSNQYKPSIASIREAHALRISGLDNAARPYIRFADLDDIRRGCEVIKGDAGRYLSQEEREVLERSVLHVDFCVEEVELLYRLILNSNPPRGTELKSRFVSMIATLKQNIAAICKTVERKVSMGGKEFGLNLLRNRDTADIRSFLEDAACGNITITPRLVCVDLKSSRGLSVPKPSISSLIREREIWGMAPYRVCQGRQAFNVEIANHIEDSFLRRSEWTDCCGDISTVSWTGDHTFVCGATAHSDYHNMQYNKPGNLLVGSALLDTLRAVDGHRIMRPVVKKAENVENALESMRQTQDPWLYTSVVSTSYSAVSQYTFTASFDETVKVWKVTEDGSSMSLCGTWKHDGKVNFVVTSETHNQVATASDVSNNAIRVYKFDELDIPGTPHDTYSGDKAQEQAAELERSDSWAYFPATIQWGRAVSVANLLLVGYSPRSSSGHEVDIPEEKKNTGELCIWNVENGQRVQISSARTQNVFEVVWHQSQPMFLAATSPCGVFEPEVKTQIRLFALNQCGSFLHIKTLDCPALDINELTIQ